MLRQPTQQITLPLQPPSPLSAPQAAAAAAVIRLPEVEQKVASLLARRQGMVALQLRGLPISRHNAYKETWARACKVGLACLISYGAMGTVVHSVRTCCCARRM
jgi:hypothetical protein